MANDPYFDSRLMLQGTAGAEFIYNELIARLKGAFGKIKSRTISVPPGSPLLFDSYLVAAGGSGDWSGHDGEIAIFTTGWVYMDPKPGFRFLVEDENTWITWSGTAPLASSALDGKQTIVLVLESAAWRLKWDVSLGANAYTVMDQNAILMAPANMLPGRRYDLFVKQDGVGGKTLTAEAGEWAATSVALLPISTTANQVSILRCVGPQAPFSKPTILEIDSPYALV
jgi:hypothetical protein